MSQVTAAARKSVRTYLQMIIFKTESYNIAPTGLIFMIHLPQSSEYWELRYVPPHSSQVTLFLFFFLKEGHWKPGMEHSHLNGKGREQARKVCNSVTCRTHLPQTGSLDGGEITRWGECHRSCPTQERFLLICFLMLKMEAVVHLLVG